MEEMGKTSENGKSEMSFWKGVNTIGKRNKNEGLMEGTKEMMNRWRERFGEFLNVRVLKCLRRGGVWSERSRTGSSY